MSSLSSNWDIGTVSESPDDTTSSSSTLTSSAISGVSDFWCKIAPIFCDTSTGAVEDDGADDASISDGTANNVDLALAVPLKTISLRSVDPKDFVHLKWEIFNDGDKVIDTALFLMNGSQIHDNQGGKIYTGDESNNIYSNYVNVDYPEIYIPPEYFYSQLDNIYPGREADVDVGMLTPACSLGDFEAPIFALYRYDIDSNLMLTFASDDWWDELMNQELISKLTPTKSKSTVGPFSISIYPESNQQPVMVSINKRFIINFDISKNHRGRAAISDFVLYISDKLIPQVGDLCDLEASSVKSYDDMLAYELKSDKFNEINSADIRLNDGLNEDMNYQCPFLYDPAWFDIDFKDKGSVQRYMKIHMEYTYIYNGMFTFNTKNVTGFDECLG
ncbi:MAG: hypothetical protein GQ477_00470, partial [Nanohaloarchaea archaeon]|nr:hypothetical protein [Candidatus Nanohaloarchaea archaeon]